MTTKQAISKTDLTPEVLVAAIEQLEAAGVYFYIYSADGESCIEPNEIPEYMRDPDAFCAKAHGVSLEVYRDFIFDGENSDGAPQCCGMTKKGKRCRRRVDGAGRGQNKLSNYAKFHGGYCSLHGG
jgi:hypothetical protein